MRMKIVLFEGKLIDMLCNGDEVDIVVKIL